MFIFLEINNSECKFGLRLEATFFFFSSESIDSHDACGMSELIIALAACLCIVSSRKDVSDFLWYCYAWLAYLVQGCQVRVGVNHRREVASPCGA